MTRRHAPARPPALDSISLAIPPRQFVAIVGPSGSGKSTLLRMINKLDSPDAGSVQVENEDVAQADAVPLRRRIGYVFQGVGLFPHMTVAENIGITPRLLGWPMDRINERVDELLDLVRLAPEIFRQRMPHQLSGGQRQRIGVARAVAAKPRIMLMDEPFGALDPITRDSLTQDYRSLHDSLALTTIMVTHDMTEALLLADRIVVMRGGHIVAEGPPDKLMDNGDPFVSEMLETPLRQAERLQALRQR
ncbi:MAG TPA: ABC transporter ATP-binding protein [Xanthobacteraceae bacterium]|nr:ABC transporter ATP-binding protein [Xanthobacteraceae bacterium]